MKIGIFGDSFAEGSKDYSQQNPRSIIAWPDFLREEFEIYNHAKTASSLFYSINSYKQSYTLYDKKIFIVTYPGRFELPNDVFERIDIEKDKFTNNITSVDQKIKKYQQLNLNEIAKLFQAAKDYYIYLYNKELQEYIHELMINDIKNLAYHDNNTLIIPAKSNDPNTFFMEQVLYFENKHWDLDDESYNKQDCIDKRVCHMTVKNNFIFYQKIKEWIDTGTFNVSIDDFEKPSLEDKKLYIRYE